MKGKPQQAANISEDELTCNSYNTTEEEEDDSKKDSLYKIQLRKEKMNKFFIENPYLEGQLDLGENDGHHGGKGAFAEDAPIDATMKYWESISKEVDSTYNVKKKTKVKTLDQIMKRINVFKSRLDTLDRNPILKKILEKDSRENSRAGPTEEEEEKKKEKKGQDEFVYYSFRKKMQAEYQKLLKDKRDKKSEEPDKKKIVQNPKGGVHMRLANKKEQSEETSIKVDENLKIKYESGKKLYQDLSKAKSEQEYRAIARDHWDKFKTSYKKSLDDLKSHQFIQNFVKENKKYNIYLPDFNKEKKKAPLNEEEEAKQKEALGEDEEIFTMIDKIMSGAVYEKWRSLQDKDL